MTLFALDVPSIGVSALKNDKNHTLISKLNYSLTLTSKQIIS